MGVLSLRYSGGSTNKFAIASIGGEMSSEPIPNAQLENLFDDVSRVEVINGRIEHRCFFLLNEDVDDFHRIKFTSITIPADTEISFAVDPAPIPQSLTTEDSTPVGLRFYKFDEWNELEIPIGKLDIGDAIAVWIKRKVLVGSDDTRTIGLTIDGDDNTLVISQDFSSLQNSFDNDFITNRSSQFLTDVDFVGESLLS